MQSIHSLLVVLEPTLEKDADESLALDRACLIAGVTNAHLHLLICDKKYDHSAALKRLLADLQADDFSVSIEQNWHHSVHETIIRSQQAEGCGLVIKQHFPDNPLKKALLTPEDWKLLRQCPAPVLMVKSDRPWHGGVILAAVDVGNSDEQHKQLHFDIVDHGFDIASLAKGSLHVIAAHPSPMLSAADPLYPPTQDLATTYREQCRAFQEEFDIDDQHLHIAEGAADVLIPYTAHQLDAVVTVIGTVARSGIAGALIGNTAEVVLDSLEGDVLVLKTDEFIGHLQAELAAS
jgi:nucleotide-binding universal stress UspA family protein